MAESEIDANTFEGCRRGDPEAQRRVFERYKDRVFSIALNFLKGDDAAAKDVTQEVFVKVFRGRGHSEARKLCESQVPIPAGPGFAGNCRTQKSSWGRNLARVVVWL